MINLWNTCIDILILNIELCSLLSCVVFCFNHLYLVEASKGDDADQIKSRQDALEHDVVNEG